LADFKFSFEIDLVVLLVAPPVVFLTGEKFPVASLLLKLAGLKACFKVDSEKGRGPHLKWIVDLFGEREYAFTRVLLPLLLKS
jgi:hypothetical protein